MLNRAVNLWAAALPDGSRAACRISHSDQPTGQSSFSRGWTPRCLPTWQTLNRALSRRSPADAGAFRPGNGQWQRRCSSPRTKTKAGAGNCPKTGIVCRNQSANALAQARFVLRYDEALAQASLRRSALVETFPAWSGGFFAGRPPLLFSSWRRSSPALRSARERNASTDFKNSLGRFFASRKKFSPWRGGRPAGACLFRLLPAPLGRRSARKCVDGGEVAIHRVFVDHQCSLVRLFC